MNGCSPQSPPTNGGRVKANYTINIFHPHEESTLFTVWFFNCPVFVEATSPFYLDFVRF